ncbi:MAG TPA: hypothetical protein VK456_03225 [Xanthobacteraceae bacterium]|nr:hypothetical protein [Xanthobacteraceae bacterium]
MIGYENFRTVACNGSAHFVAISIFADHDIRPLGGFTAAKFERYGPEIRTEDCKEAGFRRRRRTGKRRRDRLRQNIAGERASKSEKKARGSHSNRFR